MKLYLKIWRQTNVDSNGSFQNYEIDEITPEMKKQLEEDNPNYAKFRNTPSAIDAI